METRLALLLGCYVNSEVTNIGAPLNYGEARLVVRIPSEPERSVRGDTPFDNF